MRGARHRRFHQRRNRIDRLPGTGPANVRQTVYFPLRAIDLYTVHARSEERSTTMSPDFEPRRFARSVPLRLQCRETLIAPFKFDRRAVCTRRSRMASAFAARRRSPARFELRASCADIRTPGMSPKRVDKLKTRVATETVLSEFAGSRHAAAVARPGVRTLVRYGFGGTGTVCLSDNHRRIRARGNLAAWIGVRGRRIPTGSNALRSHPLHLWARGHVRDAK